jgi:methyl-accepting chemotaxis protein
MSAFDFARMKMVHSTWILKLRGFVHGRENLDSKDLVSHRDCDLGKWIYSTGLATYGHLPAMQQLERAHKSMHDLAQRVVKLRSAGSLPEAEQEFSKVYETSKEVTALISGLERRVKQQTNV